MSYPIKLSPKAHEDIADIYNYVIKDGETIAKKQVSLIYGAMENLSEFPNMGKKLRGYISVDTDYRFIVIHKVYLAFYRFNTDTIEVVRVLRGEQDYIKILGLK